MSDRGDRHLSVIVREDTVMVSYRWGIVNYIVGAGNVFFSSVRHASLLILSPSMWPLITAKHVIVYTQEQKKNLFLRAQGCAISPS